MSSKFSKIRSSHRHGRRHKDSLFLVTTLSLTAAHRSCTTLHKVHKKDIKGVQAHRQKVAHRLEMMTRAPLSAAPKAKALPAPPAPRTTTVNPLRGDAALLLAALLLATLSASARKLGTCHMLFPDLMVPYDQAFIVNSSQLLFCCRRMTAGCKGPVPQRSAPSEGAIPLTMDSR